MAPVPSHSALDSVHMEKTPRRSSLSSGAVPSGTASSGSVVVDPASQVPGPVGGSGPPSSRRSAPSAGGAVRRKAETTLVLQARRVDSLRRQVLERQRAQVLGRRWQVVLWGLAGAGAVLLGGWLATRLSPSSSDQLEAPLVLGRSESEGSPSPLDPPAPVDAKTATAAAPPTLPTSTARDGTGQSRTGAAANQGASEPGSEAAAAEPVVEGAARRSPDEPKVVGDWGDGFDRPAGSPGTARRSSGGDAVNLDELPTE